METPTTYNVYGGRNKANYTHCEIKKETDKAILLQVDSAEGSYLHEWQISFWIPKSVFYSNLENQGAFGNVVTLPHYFRLDVKRVQIS